MNLDDYIVDLLVDAILEDICKRTDEWADPTGEKAVEIAQLTQPLMKQLIRFKKGDKYER